MSPVPERVQEWINDGAVCSDCGHLHANHDCGWCYTCAKAERQCGHIGRRRVREVGGQWFALPNGPGSDVGPFGTMAAAHDWLRGER